MDTLPVELHSQIFQLACIDDGGAARSLSLVSRYLHQVAEPFLFQTLIVSGHDRLDIVAKKLENSPIHCRRVRHLFLTDQKPHQNDSLPDPSGTICHEDYDLEKSPIIRILDLTSQSLISLALNIFDPTISHHVLGHLFSLTYPHLSSLIVHGFYPFPCIPRSFPCLEYLHLSGNRNPHGLFETGGLAAACPNLSRLKISGLMFAKSFIRELEDLLYPISKSHQFCGDAPSEAGLGERASASSLPHFRCLRHMAVVPGPGPVMRRKLQVSASRRMFTPPVDETKARLERLAAWAERSSDVRVVVGDVPNGGDLGLALRLEWLGELR